MQVLVFFLPAIIFPSYVLGGTWYRFSGKEYYVESIESNGLEYKNAKKDCENRRATLAIVDSQEIQSFLVDTLSRLEVRNHAYYIGLRRDAPINGFEWADGTSATGGFVNWGQNQPNFLPDQFCVIMGFYSGYPWWDVVCDVMRRYICERPIIRTTTTITSTLTVLHSTSSANVAESETILVSNTGLTRPQLDTVSPEVTSFIEQAEQTEVTTAPENLPPLSTVAIALITLAVIVTIIIAVILLFIHKRQQKRNVSDRSMDIPEHSVEAISVLETPGSLRPAESTVYNRLGEHKIPPILYGGSVDAPTYSNLDTSRGNATNAAHSPYEFADEIPATGDYARLNSHYEIPPDAKPPPAPYDFLHRT
ncbi:uncharacterized protein LOC143460406 [Clavelina lepadiformis]|uniref:C-type lectin domain-containing protein n=1 Tax=Clavelina lepadiformis TaxID=159417 RepID=A0ABP0GFN2_CLALP